MSVAITGMKSARGCVADGQLFNLKVILHGLKKHMDMALLFTFAIIRPLAKVISQFFYVDYLWVSSIRRKDSKT
jgi:hypothetical protein